MTIPAIINSTADTPRKLLQPLGTYWSQVQRRNPQLHGLLCALAAVQQHLEQPLIELALSASREAIPVFQTTRILSLDLQRSQRNKTASAIIRYGDQNESYLSGQLTDSTPRYGLPRRQGHWYEISKYPLVSVDAVVDHPTAPTVVLRPYIDFNVFGQSIQFFNDPIPNTQSNKTWYALNAKYDRDWVYRTFGVVAGVRASESSEAYKEIVNAIFQCYVKGGGWTNILNVLAVTTGNRIVTEQETVELVTECCVVTDKNVYDIAGKVTDRKVGDVLYPGESLTNTFVPISINSGHVDERIPGISLDKDYTGVFYRGMLTFFNRMQPLERYAGRLGFDLGGWKSDTFKFWRLFHERCDVQGLNGVKILQSLSTDDGKINPCQFLVEQLARYHYNLLYVKQTQRPTSLTLGDIKIDSLLNPWSTILIYLETDMIDTLDNSVSDESVSTATIFMEDSFTAKHSITTCMCAYGL